MKTIYYYFISTAIIIGLNIFSFLITRGIDYQLAWIAFLLVWVDLALAWLINSKAQAIMYFFYTTAFIIEVLLIINYYWVQGLGKVL